ILATGLDQYRTFEQESIFTVKHGEISDEPGHRRGRIERCETPPRCVVRSREAVVFDSRVRRSLPTPRCIVRSREAVVFDSRVRRSLPGRSRAGLVQLQRSTAAASAGSARWNETRPGSTN
ncbi:MAG: hypothetical protein L0191_16060, partial [Acidobacteria bacterium]|nr:hypothetical protein [Acidobacteriota bacterium]